MAVSGRSGGPHDVRCGHAASRAGCQRRRWQRRRRLFAGGGDARAACRADQGGAGSRPLAAAGRCQAQRVENARQPRADSIRAGRERRRAAGRQHAAGAGRCSSRRRHCPRLPDDRSKICSDGNAPSTGWKPRASRRCRRVQDILERIERHKLFETMTRLVVGFEGREEDLKTAALLCRSSAVGEAL